MNVNNHGIFLVRFVIGGIDQPSLNLEALVRPLDVFALAPCRLHAVVQMRDLLEIVEFPRPHLWSALERASDKRHSARRTRHRESHSLSPYANCIGEDSLDTR